MKQEYAKFGTLYLIFKFCLKFLFACYPKHAHLLLLPEHPTGPWCGSLEAGGCKWLWKLENRQVGSGGESAPYGSTEAGALLVKQRESQEVLLGLGSQALLKGESSSHQ